MQESNVLVIMTWEVTILTFGERLRQLRTSNKLSQEGLSNQINQLFHTKLNKSAISRLENDTQKPTVELLEILAQYFDVSLDFINGGGKMGVDTDYDEILSIRQDMRENPEMKVLFSLSKKAPKNDVQEAIRLLHLLKKTRNGEDNGM